MFSFIYSFENINVSRTIHEILSQVSYSINILLIINHLYREYTILTIVSSSLKVNVIQHDCLSMQILVLVYYTEKC